MCACDFSQAHCFRLNRWTGNSWTSIKSTKSTRLWQIKVKIVRLTNWSQAFFLIRCDLKYFHLIYAKKCMFLNVIKLNPLKTTVWNSPNRPFGMFSLNFTDIFHRSMQCDNINANETKFYCLFIDILNIYLACKSIVNKLCEFDIYSQIDTKQSIENLLIYYQTQFFSFCDKFVCVCVCF